MSVRETVYKFWELRVHLPKAPFSGKVSDFASTQAHRAQDMASGSARCDVGGAVPKMDLWRLIREMVFFCGRLVFLFSYLTPAFMVQKRYALLSGSGIPRRLHSSAMMILSKDILCAMTQSEVLTASENAVIASRIGIPDVQSISSVIPVNSVILSGTRIPFGFMR